MRVLFVLSEYSLHNHLIERYLQSRPHDKIGIIKVPLVIKGKNRAETARKILPKAAKNFIAAKLLEFIAIGIITLIPKIYAAGEVFRRLRSIAERNRLPFFKSENVMDDGTLRWIDNFKPDLIITLFHQIIKEPLISIPTRAILNIHPGVLPEYRGIQPYFWELANGSEWGGSTVHYISDEGIDTGNIVGYTRHRLPVNCSVQLNYYL